MNRPPRRHRIDRHAAAEQRLCAQPPQHQVGVGHGRLAASRSVARRARPGARRPRPDAQRAAGVDPADAAAAGAYRVDVQHRHADRQAAHLGVAGERDRTAMYHADVEAGAAHVRGDQVAGTRCRAGDGGAGHEAAGRARHHRLHRAAAGGARRHHAAARLHDEQRRSDVVFAQPLFQSPQVVRDHRLHKGVHGTGAEALVLALLAHQLVRQAHRCIRQAFGEHPAHLTLMRRVDVAVQQTHRHRLDPLPAQQVDKGVKLLAVDRGLRAAVEAHAFAQLEAQRARHQRAGAAGAQVVQPRAVLALNLQHVAKAGGGNQRHARPGTLQHRVGSHRGAVNQQLDLFRVCVDSLDDCTDALNNPARRVVRRGHYLVERQPSAVGIERHQIGERAPGIDADPDHAAPPPYQDSPPRSIPGIPRHPGKRRRSRGYSVLIHRG